MIRLKQKKITALLRQSLQEEAQSIDPPSCQKLWGELQQRPEFIPTVNRAEQFFLKQSNERKNRQTFWRKYRPLASVIAAGVFMAVILIRLLPLIDQEDASLQEQISAPETGLQAKDGETDRGAAASFTDDDTETSLKNFSLRSAVEEKMPARPPAPAAGSAEKNEAGQPYTAFDAHDQALPMPEEQLHDSRLSRSPLPPPKEHAYEEETSFYEALKHAQQLTTEEIWQVKLFPEDFNFQEGKIVRTDTALFTVSQVFTGKEGRRFSLLQQFAQNATETEHELDAAAAVQSPAQPIQVGSYPGYLFRPSHETCTLTWQQEKSLVTLEGQLEEKALYEIIATLEKPPRYLPE